MTGRRVQDLHGAKGVLFRVRGSVLGVFEKSGGPVSTERLEFRGGMRRETGW